MVIRRSKLILLGAVLVIFGIFLFAFFGFGDSGNAAEELDEDSYHLQRRFAPSHLIENDKKSPPKMWPPEGVDVVYFWTRPLVYERVAEFEAVHRKESMDPDAEPEDMSSDFAQMQFYFARGLEHFAPWMRTLIVVVPDSVDVRPFNDSDPRVRYVKHSQILPEGAAPVFNWRALLTNFYAMEKNVSAQFVYADDMNYLISYYPATNLRNTSGEIKLPIVNEALSTPMGAVEANILKRSGEAVRTCISEYKSQLGFTQDNLDAVFAKHDLPRFETRGLTLLDRHVLTDLYSVCHGPLEATRLHRLRKADDVDIIYMHHAFIYYMRELYRHPLSVQSFIAEYDHDKDGRLSREELIELAKGLDFEAGAVGKWIGTLLNEQEYRNQSSFPLAALTANPTIFSRIADRAVRPRFRYQLTTSTTVAIELRKTIPLKLGTVLPALKSGTVASLWIGPRILGPSGGDTFDAIEVLLWNILRRKFSTLETVYKPPAKLGLLIGVGYFCLFFFGTWAVTKWLLRTPRKSND